jgi:hypothetical protein
MSLGSASNCIDGRRGEAGASLLPFLENLGNLARNGGRLFPHLDTLRLYNFFIHPSYLQITLHPIVSLLRGLIRFMARIDL